MPKALSLQIVIYNESTIYSLYTGKENNDSLHKGSLQ